jgi:hypothetical protein
MEIHGTRGVESYLATDGPTPLRHEEKADWEKHAEELDRLRRLKQASDALETNEISQGGVAGDQLPVREDGEVVSVSSPEEARKKEVSDPVRLAAYSTGAEDFLNAMIGILPNMAG